MRVSDGDGGAQALQPARDHVPTLAPLTGGQQVERDQGNAGQLARLRIGGSNPLSHVYHCGLNDAVNGYTGTAEIDDGARS